MSNESVRVPNVTPGAVSGIDHERLGDVSLLRGSQRQELDGELVDSDTAGTGQAVNADTGEVTEPGDQLPTIEGEDGEELSEEQLDALTKPDDQDDAAGPEDPADDVPEQGDDGDGDSA